MENPKISVIIPVYKAENFLNRCVDSILAQTFQNFEVLLIDDGSPDRSNEICDRYALQDSRIKVIHKENRGVSHSRNVGIDNAIGDWIFFLDSDDWLSEKCFDLLIDTVVTNKLDFSQVSFQQVDCDGVVTKKRMLDSGICRASEYIVSDSICINLWVGLYKRDIIVKNNIRFDELMKLAEDQKFLFDYLNHCDYIQTIPVTCYNYFCNLNGAMRNTKVHDLVFCALNMWLYKINNRLFSKRCDAIIASHIYMLIEKKENTYAISRSLFSLIDRGFKRFPTRIFYLARVSFFLFYYLLKIRLRYF